ncbi:MAG: hypothetical protein HY459_01380, partial [Parcubacteria group bacterium]|nr:hypothetical protein [Parcubacteria group bacterium]
LGSFKLEAVFGNNSIEELAFTPALAEMEPGDEAIFSNSSYVTCSDLDRLIFRSNTCPSDARDEIGSEDISGC